MMSTHRPIRVLITGDLFSFPTGTGATTRVTAVGRGLQDAGALVQILVTRFVEVDSATALNPAARGMSQGLPFTYTTGTSVRPSTLVQRRYARARGILASAAPFTWRDPPDAVLLFTGHTLALPVVNRLATWSRDAILLFDGCERPFVYEQGSAAMRAYERIYTPLAYKLYDGFMVISEYLERYFRARARPDARMIRIPILVDVDRFASRANQPPQLERPYVAYTGVIGDSKGVIDLVRAFARLAPEFPQLDLVLSGGPTCGPYPDELRRIAAQLEVGSRVKFVGTLPCDRFPALLQNAEALVVPHISGTWAEAAFPTKLGEYLASGTPTVATRVGEIDRFVHDGYDAFLVPPDDPVALSERLTQILRNPAAAREVGAKGQTTARRSFDYRMHGARLAAFIGELKATRKLSSSRRRSPRDQRPPGHRADPEHRSNI